MLMLLLTPPPVAGYAMFYVLFALAVLCVCSAYLASLPLPTDTTIQRGADHVAAAVVAVLWPVWLPLLAAVALGVAAYYLIRLAILCGVLGAIAACSAALRGLACLLGDP